MGKLVIDFPDVKRAAYVSERLQQALNIYGGTLTYPGDRHIEYHHDDPTRLLDKLIGLEIIDPCKEITTIENDD